MIDPEFLLHLHPELIVATSASTIGLLRLFKREPPDARSISQKKREASWPTNERAMLKKIKDWEEYAKKPVDGMIYQGAEAPATKIGHSRSIKITRADETGFIDRNEGLSHSVHNPNYDPKSIVRSVQLTESARYQQAKDEILKLRYEIFNNKEQYSPSFVRNHGENPDRTDIELSE